MRVALIVAGLIALPFGMAVAQNGKSPAHQDPKNCGKHLNHSERAASRRPVVAHNGAHGVMDLPCTVTTPPPPPPSSPPSTGPSLLGGRVFNAVEGTTLAGWTVTLAGPVTQSQQTDSQGNYIFSGLTEGSYVLCALAPDGWYQQAPNTITSCPSAVGYVVVVAGSQAVLGLDFFMVAY